MEGGQTVYQINVSKNLYAEMCVTGHARGWHGKQFVEQALRLACRFYGVGGAHFVDGLETLKQRSTAVDGLWEFAFMGMEECYDPETPSYFNRLYDRVVHMHAPVSGALHDAISSLSARWNQLRTDETDEVSQ
jgi:hypothetical protein